MAIGSTPTQQVNVALVGAVTTDTVTIAAATGTLFLDWGTNSATQTITSVTSTNTVWSSVMVKTTTGAVVELWIGVVTGTSGPTVTINTSLAMNVAAVRGSIFEFSGVAATAFLATTTNDTTGSTAVTTPSISPTVGANSLRLAIMRQTLTGSLASGPSLNWIDITPSGSAFTRCAYQVSASDSGTAQNTWNWTAANPWADGICVLYALSVALTFSQQPPTSIATGTTPSPTVTVTADAAASGRTIVLTLSGPNGSITGASAVCNGSGVATFSGLVMNGDGPGFTLTATLSGYTTVVSNAVNIIGQYVAANQAFNTAMGGDTFLISAHDPRIFANGALSSWPDLLTGIGSRAAGLTMAAATAPVVASGKLTLTAASTQSMQSAADARLNFVGSGGTPNPIHLLFIGSCATASPLAGIAADPTSTTTYPYAYVKPSGSTWQVAVASDGATATPTNPPIPNSVGIFTNDSGVAFAGGATRAIILGKLGFQTLNNVDHTWGVHFLMGGKGPRYPGRVNLATAGSCKLAVGRFGANYGDGSVSWMGVYLGDLTLAKKMAFKAFALAQFGATVEIVAVPRVAAAGSSIVNSTTQQPGGDMRYAANGSGTTSFPYYMANKNSGRGTFAAQGIDTNIHTLAYGLSGKGITEVINNFPLTLALYADGTTTGTLVFLFHDVGNSLVTLTKAQYLAACITLKGLCDALAITSGMRVKLVHLLDEDRGSYYPLSWANAQSTLSANGTDRVSIAVTMLASPSTYGAAVYDISTLTHEQIGNFPTPDCYSTTYFNITMNGGFGGGDTTHQAPAGYQIIGEGVKAFLDANDGILYPSSGTGPPQMGFKLSLGF